MEASTGTRPSHRYLPPPPPRTKWTRRVPHPVLIGHDVSVRTAHEARTNCGLPAPARRQFFALRFVTVCHATYLSLYRSVRLTTSFDQFVMKRICLSHKANLHRAHLDSTCRQLNSASFSAGACLHFRC
jgi:hypothetical protein